MYILRNFLLWGVYYNVLGLTISAFLYYTVFQSHNSDFAQIFYESQLVLERFKVYICTQNIYFWYVKEVHQHSEFNK